MSLKKTPFSFLSGISSNKNNENSKWEKTILSRKNSYEHIKESKVSEFGDFKILNVLLRGLSSIVCLCEWTIDLSRTLYLNHYVNYINNNILNENIQIKIRDTTNTDNISIMSNNKDTNTTVEIKDREKLEYCDIYDIEKSKNKKEIKNGEYNLEKINFKYNNNKIIHLVLKLKHKGLNYKISEIEQLREEIAIHKELNHFNILQMILCGEDENDIWVFFEYSSIGDLYSYVGFKTLEENEVKIIVSQILFALYYLHMNGIIHCDIKLQNILLFPLEPSLFERNDLSNTLKMNNSKKIKLNINKLLDSINENNQSNKNNNTFKSIIKLCDFGLSVKCKFDEFYPYRGIKGSSGFIAPELFQECDFNNKIDMWALGIIVFILLGGYRPFYPYSRFEEKVTFHERYWINISPEAKNFIQSLLQINPSKRLNVIEAMNHPWIKSYFIIT
ncbi:calcium/calmodulin-dependent protein kinase, putative [Plasmodium gallinaceum]|uniref:Calcium/calmodulin-dependent protein kinase, putative n=1 Tax=Plasmodium gallinaceum TaxID=5849 RepID=A0A1J1GYU1_PLAGA|nr:calcium/calmodulin-dependent protein kinase, putative [Plasmodium gallinaceum]CRG97624.1 calcium/calmodulin-dependent protein kinase, putative [Plasmodium gallinaceum]